VGEATSKNNQGQSSIMDLETKSAEDVLEAEEVEAAAGEAVEVGSTTATF
jgi:hypothetical protein